MPSPHSIRVWLLIPVIGLAIVRPHAATVQASTSSYSTFSVFMGSKPIGTEQVWVEQTADGWKITGSSRLGGPINLVAPRIQARYKEDWTPIDLYVDLESDGKSEQALMSLSGQTVRTTLTDNGFSWERVDTISPDSVLLAVPLWSPFEAVAARLERTESGSTIPAFNLYQPPTRITVGQSVNETIQTATATIHARRTSLQLPTPDTPLEVEMWTDEQGRLLRYLCPAQTLDVVRDDIATIVAGRTAAATSADQDVRVQANGFTLAATVSKPLQAAAGAMPAVVLVGSSGPADRDETLFGVPVFSQIGAALTDAGFLVVRYDKRGTGASGGRAESATLGDYAEDLRQVVRFVSDRKDVDRRRIAVLGHGEGGAVALLTAGKEKRVAALVLASASSVSGADLNVYQVTHAMERSKRSEADRQATIALQKRIQDAVMSGKGWEGISPDIRRQADTPWFESMLSFNPSKAINDVDQPILIVQGDRDPQLPPGNADRLGAIAKGRKKSTAEVANIPGVNHLLVATETGEADEYETLKGRPISPLVTDALVTWLRRTLASFR